MEIDRTYDTESVKFYEDQFDTLGDELVPSKSSPITWVHYVLLGISALALALGIYFILRKQ